MRIAVPVVKAGEKTLLVPHFGRAPSFAVVEVEDKNYRILEVFPNAYSTHEHGKVHGLLSEMTRRGVQALLTLEVGYGAFYRLRELGIKIYYVDPPPGKATITLEEALNKFLAGEAQEGLAPRETDAEPHGPHHRH